MRHIQIGICQHSVALKSAVYGLEELFLLANRICEAHQLNTRFSPSLVTDQEADEKTYDIIILPPCMADQSEPTDEHLIHWLVHQHQQGSILASVCVGAFTLAATGLLGHRTVTTHWSFEDTFRQQFPNQPIDVQQILIDHGDIISAGGVMSWLDLGLELITKYSSPFVRRQIGKTLVIDTMSREQSFYQQFSPSFSHGDQVVIQAQQWLALHYSEDASIKALAQHSNLTERTLLRRFVKATRLTPNQYLQRFRIQMACNLLESTRHPFESIAYQVGYLDSSACRKVFVKIMGLTPTEYRKRF